MTIEKWNLLSDEQKWFNYELLSRVQQHQSSILSQIADYLLGEDWYVVHGDWESTPKEILKAIQYKYPNENYAFHRQISKIKKNIHDYFTKR